MIRSDYRRTPLSPDPTPMPQKLPGPLRLAPSFPFAGRSHELALLRALIPGEVESLRFALVGGEAGSGKSRLVREFAHEAAANGALRLYGACDAVVQRPYRPFVEALEQLVRTADAATLRADLGPAGGELTRLLPDLPPHVGELPAPVAAEPDTERHRLHVAVADLLAAVGRRAPLVVVVEDGHRADTPTLLLLRPLARSAADARALVVTTFRDTEADVPRALAEALVDLRRTEGVVRMRLAGLSAPEIAEFVARALGGDIGPDLSAVGATLRDLTGGNAFLMTALWRTLLAAETIPMADAPRLAAALAGLGSPEGVRELVGQRLDRLTPAAIGLLDRAAVAGPEFDLSVVARAGGPAAADCAPSVVAPAGVPAAELAAAVEQAVSHGMIEEVPARRLASQFSPEL